MAWVGRLLPAAAPVLLPARPDRQPQHRLVRPRTIAGSTIDSASASASPRRGGGSFVPWFNAPPGTEQRLGVFYLLSSGEAERRARARRSSYTHGDRFPDLPGYRTFTSHWHMAIAMAAMKEKAEGRPAIDARLRQDVQGHGRGHRPPRRVPRRRPSRRTPARSAWPRCRRCSTSAGASPTTSSCSCPARRPTSTSACPTPGRQPGHWLYLFPKPVYWTMKRAPGQPFVEDDRPLRAGLSRRRSATTCSPPPRAGGRPGLDGAPADQGLELDARRLPPRGLLPLRPLAGRRLEGDARRPLARPAGPTRRSTCSTTWPTGASKKYLPGEVDVFKIDHTHELYGHMNINYLRLEPDRLPRFDEGWQPVLDSLRGGPVLRDARARS